MVTKTVVMLLLFVIPLIVINSGVVSSPFTLIMLYIICGFGMAGIGMSVMHDANHGAYSKNKKVNKYLGYTMNLIGASSNVWQVKHNILHHNYTNIDDFDDDIRVPFFIRLSPHAKKHWIHRFQHLYIWFFYSLSTLEWVTMHDFKSVHNYYKKGFFRKKNHEYRNEILKIAGWKVIYYSYTLLLPIFVVPLAPWIIVVAFIIMHFVTGLILSIVFQTAHLMRSTKFPVPDENGFINSDWTIHQLATTSNYAPKSKVFSWLIGGLNYQIEHHIMPHVCHIHYRKLSHIVATTAKEYGIPYNSKETFAAAVRDHIELLRQLGSAEPVVKADSLK